MVECECNCGYTCGGPGECELDTMECIEKHYKQDCGHDFSGPGKDIQNGWTATCKNCGMTAIGHDMVSGI